MYYKNIKSVNLYHVKETGERVKILRVYYSGSCEIVNRGGEIKRVNVEELKRIY